MADTHPLQDQSNWNKPKTWVVPVAVSVLVDNPDGYDMELEDLIKKVMNEVRAVISNFDRSGKQLQVKFLQTVKDKAVIKSLLDGTLAKSNMPKQEDLKDLINQAVQDALKAKDAG